ncbi:hypothetical protein BOX15_Mlig009890g1 [Macrostomum lignano]|uniref:One cut domain family member n=1 Tax=Macrostomum lignano TaxID=282301 RepID=A0A267GS23_9PLAT|nr:hypothetical protein BOX15_Mlig009890g1 [Macrostomum lignano]
MEINSLFSYGSIAASNSYGAGISQQVRSQPLIMASTSQSSFQVPQNIFIRSSGLNSDQMNQLMQVISLPNAKVEASHSQTGQGQQTVTLALINVDPNLPIGGQLLIAAPALQPQQQPEIQQQPVLLPNCNQVPIVSISNPRIQVQPGNMPTMAIAASVTDSSISLPLTSVPADTRSVSYQLIDNSQNHVLNATSSVTSGTMPSFAISSMSSSMPADKFEVQLNRPSTPGLDFLIDQPSNLAMAESKESSFLSNDGMKLNLSHQGIESTLPIDPLDQLDYKTQNLIYACDSNEHHQQPLLSEALQISHGQSMQIQPTQMQGDVSGFISMPNVASMFQAQDNQQDFEDSNEFFQTSEVQPDSTIQDTTTTCKQAQKPQMPIIGSVASLSAPPVQAAVSLSPAKPKPTSAKSKSQTSKAAAATVQDNAAEILVSALQDYNSKKDANSDSGSADLPTASDPLFEINTKEVAQRVIFELKNCGIPQAVFAQQVLCRSQGTLSDLLRNPKPWSKLKSGRETFRRMWKWLQTPVEDRMSSLHSASLKRSFDTADSGDCNGPLSQAQQQQQPKLPPTRSVLQPQSQSSAPAPQSSTRKPSEPNGTPAKKPRLVFTDIQRRTLNAIFNETSRPSKEMQSIIAEQLGLELSTVCNYFMNARRRSLEKWQEDSSDSSTEQRQRRCQTVADEFADFDPTLSAVDESEDEQTDANPAADGAPVLDKIGLFVQPLPPPPPLLNFSAQQQHQQYQQASSSSSISSGTFSVCSTGL